MKPSAIVQKLREARSEWLDLNDPDLPGLRVLVERPPESEFWELKVNSRAELAAKWVWGWEGFSEATFFGSAIGSADALPFDAGLWAFVSRDHAKWIEAVFERLLSMVVKHTERTQQDEKN
jgi:hypothetical protein